MKYILYATSQDGSGLSQKIGEFDDITDIQIRIRLFSKDTVINIEEEYEKES